MKKVLVSLSAIAIIGTMAAAGTGAFFSDTETSTGNTFAAATLDLTLDTTGSLPFNVTNVAPGATGSTSFTVTNAGTIPGFLDIGGSNLGGIENGCTEPELVTETACLADTISELPSNITLVVTAGATQLFSGSLASFATSNLDNNFALAAGATQTITVTYTVDSAADNRIQSDTASLDLNFELGQTTTQ
jgi:predicted ribosomally synthesized peptide with SipW-like signal peptide